VSSGGKRVHNVADLTRAAGPTACSAVPVTVVFRNVPRAFRRRFETSNRAVQPSYAAMNVFELHVSFVIGKTVLHTTPTTLSAVVCIRTDSPFPIRFLLLSFFCFVLLWFFIFEADRYRRCRAMTITTRTVLITTESLELLRDDIMAPLDLRSGKRREHVTTYGKGPKMW